jgi:addiction module HigA family antidote
MFLSDMQIFCDKILRYTNGLNQQAFFANDVVLDAVLRNLELLGEASKQIPEDVRQLNLQVSASILQRLIRCQSRLTPDMALRLSRVVGRSAESWLALQDHHDLWSRRQQLDLSELHRLEWLPA